MLASAPRESSAFTIGREPFSAPVISGVEPSSRTALTSAPDCEQRRECNKVRGAGGDEAEIASVGWVYDIPTGVTSAYLQKKRD